MSEDDPDLTSFLNSLEVNDCFGIVTIDADEINIRDRENTDGNIVGTAKKGEIYKVYGLSDRIRSMILDADLPKTSVKTISSLQLPEVRAF